MVLARIPPVRSAIDVGCGVGTWLSVLTELGVSTIRGVDGPWVDTRLLEFPASEFRHIDLAHFDTKGERFDLACSLEVAEHLPAVVAPRFVSSLCGLADFVLFSAAIPHQGGEHHVNEQWPEYWIDLFAANGFVVVDFIRGAIWNDPGIPVWYRQNSFLFVSDRRQADLRTPATDPHREHMQAYALVHPELYLTKAERPTLRIRLLRRLQRTFRRT